MPMAASAMQVLGLQPLNLRAHPGGQAPALSKSSRRAALVGAASPNQEACPLR
jgi:hypothetical protein